METYTVTSNGLSGEEWIARLHAGKWDISDCEIQMLCDKNFIATTGVTHKLVLIKGEEFEDDDRITSKVRAEAQRRGYLAPPAEVAPLLRELITDKDIERTGLFSLTVMHEPLVGARGLPHLLSVSRYDTGRLLMSYYGRPELEWARVHGFVFLAPSAKDQNPENL